MKHLGKTAPFLGPGGTPLPGSIAEVEYLRLGGCDQWVMMRGENVANPPLVLLHGGPGMPETLFFRRFNAPLEKIFTVIYWDQRGAGKSFNRAIPRSSMTVEQFLADLDELITVVQRRFGKDKIVLLGHSWGTVLGVLYAARFPEKVSLYVGAAQIGDWPAADVSSYAFALGEAERLHNRKALERLRAVGPPPYSARRVATERTWAQRLAGQLNAKSMWQAGRALTRGPEASVFDLANVVRGFRFTLDAMWADVSPLNLQVLAPALRMPVFFFLGRRDPWVRPETSVAYFEMLSAPSKNLVWFEQSGHEMFVDEPAKFNGTMAEAVRPMLA